MHGCSLQVVHLPSVRLLYHLHSGQALAMIRIPYSSFTCVPNSSILYCSTLTSISLAIGIRTGVICMQILTFWVEIISCHRFTRFDFFEKCFWQDDVVIVFIANQSDCGCFKIVCSIWIIFQFCFVRFIRKKTMSAKKAMMAPPIMSNFFNLVRLLLPFHHEKACD